VRIAVQIVHPPRVEYKGFKYKPIRKGHVTKSLIVRTAKEILYKDGSTVAFFENSGILIKKKKQPRTIHVIGPVSKRLKRKFYLALFEEHV
jgi:large subunit ribosomal protein L14